MKRIDVEEQVPVAGHFFLALYFAVGFGLVKFLLEKSVQKLVESNKIQLLDQDVRLKSKKIARFKESLWKLVFYGAMEMWILGVILQESIYSTTANWEFFEGWPNQKLKCSEKFYYMAQCGFYLLSIVSLVGWEAPRKDSTAMISHHIVTIVLIAFSYFTRFFRVGTMTLMLHDASDVFLETAKLFKYCGIQMGANTCFIMFALSWLILRLILFPFWVIKATSYGSLKYAYTGVPNFALIYSVFNIMLISLLVLHIYWWFLICQMMFRQIKNRGNIENDIRSDSDEDEEKEERNKNE